MDRSANAGVVVSVGISEVLTWRAQPILDLLFRLVQLAAKLLARAAELDDPMWRMPLWRNYRRFFDVNTLAGLRVEAEKKRLEEELRIAHEIQMSLLPHGPLSMPGISVTALCVPAREVGGDYYDVLPLDEIVARYLKAVGDKREIVRDPEARYFGGRVEERSLVPLGEARLGRIGFDEWLRRSQARA